MEALYATNWGLETFGTAKKQSVTDSRLSDLCALLPSQTEKNEGLENLRLLKRVYLQFSKGQPFCEAENIWRGISMRGFRVVDSRPTGAVKDPELEQIFSGLAATWQEETGGLSSTTRRYSHWAYQAILRLGRDAIPLILTEINERPDWWFEALYALAKPKVNPVRPGMTFEEAVNAWNMWANR